MNYFYLYLYKNNDDIMLNLIITSKLTPIFVTIIAFFTPIIPFFYVVISLVIIDMITAIWREKKKGNLSKFQSHKFRKTLGKFVTYCVFIALVFGLDYVLTGGLLHLENISLGLIALSELYSICENMDVINNNNVFTTIFRAIRKPIEGWLTKIGDKTKE